MVYVPLPCSDPVQTGNAGNIIAGIVYSAIVHGIWEIDHSTGSYDAGTENHGKTGISTQIMWFGMGNLNSYGSDWDGIGNFVNWLGGTTGTVVRREREFIPIPLKLLFPPEFPLGLP